MAEENLDQGVKSLQALESCLWEVLLEKKPFDDWEYEIPSDDWGDKNTSILYDNINQMVEAIPAIQKMQDSKQNWGILIAKIDFDGLSPKIQKSVVYVLERARSKFDDAKGQYATFGEISGERLTEEQKESNRTLQGQLRELLTLLPATSTGAKSSTIQIVQPISGNYGVTQPIKARKPEEASCQSDGVLDRMREAAEQAAGAFGSAVQTFKNLIGMGRDRTQ
jgi:hypothetical protein